MGERKAWTKDEDEALLQIIQIRKIKRWNDVSKAMELDFNIYGRTGKQCRQRWHNQLNPVIKNTEWTAEEEHILFDLHNQFGNRWARISHELQGRTDNCVKNHFYATLRKAFRRLNRFVEVSKHKSGLKHLKPLMLSKLVAAAEDKFDKKLKLSEEQIQKSIELKNRLIPFSKQEEDTAQDDQEMQILVRELTAFCKSYKRRKSKKFKRSEDYGIDYESSQEEDSVEDSSVLKQDTPTKSTNEKPRGEHQNLFCANANQLIRDQSQVAQASKQPLLIPFLLHRPQSRIIEQQGPFQMMTKKSSIVSNWSGALRVPSFKEGISNLSLSNQFHFDSLGYDSFNIGHRSLFGVDVQNLDV